MTLHHHIEKVNVDAIRAQFCAHVRGNFVKTLGRGIAASGTYRIDQYKCVHCRKLYNVRKQSN